MSGQQNIVWCRAANERKRKRLEGARAQLATVEGQVQAEARQLGSLAADDARLEAMLQVATSLSCMCVHVVIWQHAWMVPRMRRCAVNLTTAMPLGLSSDFDVEMGLE